MLILGIIYGIGFVVALTALSSGFGWNGYDNRI